MALSSSNLAEKPKFPATVKFIVANEFCERFSFYGMRAILALYLKNSLGLSETSAVETVHLFIVASYFTPLIGAFLSDSYLGKYKTILYLSLVYCIGNWTLSFSAFEVKHANVNTAWNWVMVGLSLIALGTGGIKPCVSAFGGDQVEHSLPPGPARDVLLRSFFSAFYFSINAGAALSQLVTPWLHTQFSYDVAFGVPAVLMLLAVTFFVIGSKDYFHQPPTGNLLTTVGKVVVTAITEMFHSKVTKNTVEDSGPDSGTEPLIEGERRQRLFLTNGSVKKAVNSFGSPSETSHWLDHAKRKYNSDDVEDVKQLLRVLLLFLPAPIFWSLFDQQASRWVFQAEALDGNIPFGLTIRPEQMQTLNAVFILILIPLFDRVIYPTVDRLGGSLRPIRRMAMGMVLCACAFVASGALQSSMDFHAPSKLSMLWQVPQYIILTAGEILFSITGLELAYSQAPSSMTSVVTSFWLLTVSAGNFVTVILVAIIGNQLSEMIQYFLFAFGCLLAMAALLWVGKGFVYVESVSSEDEERGEGGERGERGGRGGRGVVRVSQLEREEEHSLSTTGM